MIIALLFLILCALLFPGAFRFLLLLMFIAGIMVLGEAHAASYQYCHGDKTCNNEFKISMATCFARLAYRGFEITDPRYEAICRGLTEDKLKEKNTPN